jgi:hypothetical protein
MKRLVLLAVGGVGHLDHHAAVEWRQLRVGTKGPQLLFGRQPGTGFIHGPHDPVPSAFQGRHHAAPAGRAGGRHTATP